MHAGGGAPKPTADRGSNGDPSQPRNSRTARKSRTRWCVLEKWQRHRRGAPHRYDPARVHKQRRRTMAPSVARLFIARGSRGRHCHRGRRTDARHRLDGPSAPSHSGRGAQCCALRRGTPNASASATPRRSHIASTIDWNGTSSAFRVAQRPRPRSQTDDTTRAQ